MADLNWILCVVALIASLKGYKADKPCIARDYGLSAVCVCNETYCDEITREPVESGRYVSYTTSESGCRFNRLSASLSKYTQHESSSITVEDLTRSVHSSSILELNPEKTYQTIVGFGGAVTDSAAINWMKMESSELMKNLIESFYGETGIEYSIIRAPIGASDFSTHEYSYNMYPENDALLTNFTLVEEDLKYKIPMIKECMDVATEDVLVIASTWSPPPWMKNTHEYTGLSHLKKEYFQTYAEYHLKFVESYTAQGIPIWAVTTGNEPLSSVQSNRINSLGWTTDNLGKWISQNLGPTFNNSKHHVKILACDDQRYTIPIWFATVVKEHPESLKYIDGVAVHFYGDQVTPPEILTNVMEKYPDKFIIGTEASAGAKPTDIRKVSLGSWERLELYAKDIIQNLNHNLVGWVDWNLCLDSEGGPNWAKNYVDATVIVFPEDKEFVKQPTFYAVGHFSKFVPRGSKRIDVQAKFVNSLPIDHVAFLTVDKTIVVVLYNEGCERIVRIRLNGEEALVLVDAKSIVTVEFPYQN